MNTEHLPGPHPIALLVGAACLCLAFSSRAASDDGLTETLHTVRLARGTDLHVLVSKRQDREPSIAALMFPGYPGILKLREESGRVSYDLAGNFLVRARRHLNTDAVFTVLVDCPVDQWMACGDGYRTSTEHVSDIAQVASDIRQKFGAKQVYLVGTSYGTVSTSFLAKGLEGQVDGAVHTATFTDPQRGPNAHGTPMRDFDWSAAALPQLFVHHRDDPCDLTRYASIAERRKHIPLVTVEGVANPRGAPCLAQSAHGFAGRERAVMSAIGEWMSTRKVVPVVGER